MSEVFRIYLPVAVAAAMPRKALRGYWETQVIEQGARPEPGGVTVRQFGNRVSIAGRASRKLEPSSKISPPHPTCIEVTSITRPERSEWVCGPECPS